MKIIYKFLINKFIKYVSHFRGIFLLKTFKIVLITLLNLQLFTSENTLREHRETFFYILIK